jgi:GTP-binding protein EngB required for normal cell division
MTSADLLTDRFAVVERFLDIAEPHLAEEPLAAARALTDRAASRLRLSGAHTVVALAGATGTGKSSLFNLLAGSELSPVGPLRPTTGEAYGCVWNPAGATSLLEWLGVDPARTAVADVEGQPGLAGLVLLDLPDLGSVAVSHQVESDRLISLVDLVVWVLDPQKYADRVVHETYLKGFPGLVDVTVLVLNRADTLTAEDTERCLADLRRLVESDGLGQAPVVATSVLTGAGVSDLRALIESAVVGRQAALLRLSGELDEVVAGLRPLVNLDVPTEAVSAGPVRNLIDALTTACGVDSVGLALERGYAYRAVPWRRAGHPYEIPMGPPQEASVRLAVREFVDAAVASVPPAWGASVHAAASPSIGEIADQLAGELAAAAPGPSRVSRPGWRWGLVRAAWWAGWLAVLGALGWWAAALATGTVPIDWFGLPGPVVLGAVGLVFVVAISLTAPSLTRRSARRFRARVHERLRGVVEVVARERVIDPVRRVLGDYDDARATLHRMP